MLVASLGRMGRAMRQMTGAVVLQPPGASSAGRQSPASPPLPPGQERPAPGRPHLPGARHPSFFQTRTLPSPGRAPGCRCDLAHEGSDVICVQDTGSLRPLLRPQEPQIQTESCQVPGSSAGLPDDIPACPAPPVTAGAHGHRLPPRPAGSEDAGEWVMMEAQAGVHALWGSRTRRRACACPP